MSSLLYARLSRHVYINSVFETDIKQSSQTYNIGNLCLTRANLCEFFLPMKNLKELVQAMARLAAEQDFKN